MQCLPFIFCQIPPVLLHQSTVNLLRTTCNRSWHWHCDRNVVQKWRTWLLMSFPVNYTRPFSHMLVTNLLSRFRIQKDSGSFTVGFGLNVMEKSEAQVEWTTPLRWQGTSGLWWRHGGRVWNQTFTRDLWLHTLFRHLQQGSVVSRLSSRPLCLLPSFSCSHHHLLPLLFFSYSVKLKIDSRLRGLNSFKVT